MTELRPWVWCLPFLEHGVCSWNWDCELHEVISNATTEFGRYGISGL